MSIDSTHFADLEKFASVANFTTKKMHSSLFYKTISFQEFEQSTNLYNDSINSHCLVLHNIVHSSHSFCHSAATFCFIVPFLISPAVSALQHSFLPTICYNAAGRWMEGKANCQWSSCREGCTKEIYSCWQVSCIK